MFFTDPTGHAPVAAAPQPARYTDYRYPQRADDPGGQPYLYLIGYSYMINGHVGIGSFAMGLDGPIGQLSEDQLRRELMKTSGASWVMPMAISLIAAPDGHATVRVPVTAGRVHPYAYHVAWIAPGGNYGSTDYGSPRQLASRTDIAQMTSDIIAGYKLPYDRDQVAIFSITPLTGP